MEIYFQQKLCYFHSDASTSDKLKLSALLEKLKKVPLVTHNTDMRFVGLTGWGNGVIEI